MTVTTEQGMGEVMTMAPDMDASIESTRKPFYIRALGGLAAFSRMAAEALLGVDPTTQYLRSVQDQAIEMRAMAGPHF